jgi:hypothetical protein
VILGTNTNHYSYKSLLLSACVCNYISHIAIINTQFLLRPQKGLNYFEEITRSTFYPEISLLNIIPRIENRPTLNEKNNGIRDRRDSGRLASTSASHAGGSGFKFCCDTDYSAGVVTKSLQTNAGIVR